MIGRSFVALATTFTSAIVFSSAQAAPCSGTFLPGQRFLFAIAAKDARSDAASGVQRLSGIAVVSETVEEASRTGREAILVVSEGANLDDPTFERAAISRFQKRENDDLVKLVTLTLGSGLSVTLSADQPVANPYGDLIPAGAFRLGQSLLKANGTYGLVRGIESSPSYDPLYDITLKGRRAGERILVVSDGVLVGLNRCGRNGG